MMRNPGPLFVVTLLLISLGLNLYLLLKPQTQGPRDVQVLDSGLPQVVDFLLTAHESLLSFSAEQKRTSDPALPFLSPDLRAERSQQFARLEERVQRDGIRQQALLRKIREVRAGEFEILSNVVNSGRDPAEKELKLLLSVAIEAGNPSLENSFPYLIKSMRVGPDPLDQNPPSPARILVSTRASLDLVFPCAVTQLPQMDPEKMQIKIETKSFSKVTLISTENFSVQAESLKHERDLSFFCKDQQFDVKLTFANSSAYPRYRYWALNKQDAKLLREVPTRSRHLEVIKRSLKKQLNFDLEEPAK